MTGLAALRIVRDKESEREMVRAVAAHWRGAPPMAHLITVARSSGSSNPAPPASVRHAPSLNPPK
eukprot:68609-Prymnesium_polylepis.1